MGGGDHAFGSVGVFRPTLVIVPVRDDATPSKLEGEKNAGAMEGVAGNPADSLGVCSANSVVWCNGRGWTVEIARFTRHPSVRRVVG